MKGSVSVAVLRVDVQAPLDEQFTIAKRTIIKSAMMEVELMSSPTAPYSTAKASGIERVREGLPDLSLIHI